MPGLDGKNDLLGFAVSLVFVVEVEATVDARVARAPSPAR